MGKLSNVWEIFYRPSAVAASVGERPAWVLPVVLILVISFVTAYCTYPYYVEYANQLRAKIAAHIGRELDQRSLLQLTLAKRIQHGVTASIALVVIFVLIGSAIFHGVALVAGGKSRFSRLFCYFAYAWLIPSVGGLAKLPLVVAKKSIDVRSSLAALTPGVAFGSPLYVVLNSVDAFYIWMIAAMIIGFSALTGLGSKKSTVIVVGLYVLFVVLSLGTTLISKRFTG
ncbi:MAG TPA: YIP1 family protein [bacterium]|nr:YIP1 family protein [bacterium]